MNDQNGLLDVAMTVSLATIAASAQADNANSALEAKATEIIKRDFRDKGIAKADRVNQDELQAMCSKYAGSVARQG